MIPRSKLIEKSLGCFDAGVAALLPGFGLIAAVVALVRFRDAVVATNDRWNPARLHLYLGASLALLSLLVHALIALLFYVQVLRRYGYV